MNGSIASPSGIASRAPMTQRRRAAMVSAYPLEACHCCRLSPSLIFACSIFHVAKGICCEYGDGQWSLYLGPVEDGKLLNSGGEYELTQSVLVAGPQAVSL